MLELDRSKFLANIVYAIAMYDRDFMLYTHL